MFRQYRTIMNITDIKQRSGGFYMNTYKEIVTEKNNERKEIICALLHALETRDEKLIDRLTLKMGIFAGRPTDIGFSCHDLLTFWKANNRVIPELKKDIQHTHNELQKVTKKIMRNNGIGVTDRDKAQQRINHFWYGVYTRRLNSRLRLNDIISEQLAKRDYDIVHHEYRNVKRTAVLA